MSERVEPKTATGYSDKWDLAEAMRDAIDKLPKDSEYQSYTVVHVGAEVGGFVGVNRMVVVVREA